jgi:hypothetical protein
MICAYPMNKERSQQCRQQTHCTRNFCFSLSGDDSKRTPSLHSVEDEETIDPQVKSGACLDYLQVGPCSSGISTASRRLPVTARR